MSKSIAATLHDRVAGIENTPSIPTIFLPLLDLLNLPPEKVKLDEVVKLVSYDNTIAAQCLRVASSPLFGLAKSPETIRAAVISLGLRKVETILLTCCLGNAFPTKDWPLDPAVFWKHSLGCAMVCRKFCEKLGSGDSDKAYMAGLLHDIGFIVNCIAFPKEFALATARASQEQTPLDQAELATMGFTHCESGRALAEKWHLSDDMIQVIAHHHAPAQSKSARSLIALVHLSDLLCRMRGMGYGYYERLKVDLASDPAWSILLEEHRDLANVDIALFSFQLDDAVAEVVELVSAIFGGSRAQS
ncbi:MAG: HDOD domain-containing protein [Candidatus Sulfotelmatobacter sp.]|jgi:putative nucleotidyltransferase with HDIG domain